MRILISNDDGIAATGICQLAERLSREPENEVYVVAPDRQRSAAGHALTLHKPLRVEKVEMSGRIAGAWSTTGTPSDCVKFAVIALLKHVPDVVIAGINHGPNLGNDVLLSGTVSAALEGSFLNIPSLAVSLALGSELYFATAAEFVTHFVKILPDIKLSNDCMLNINVPSLPASEIKQAVFTKLGYRLYNDHFEKHMDPRGKVYYWLAGHAIEESNEENTDTWAISHNYISITPISFNMTDHQVLASLKNWTGLPGVIAGCHDQSTKPSEDGLPS